jgi:predicted AAA+ superfamily ATPase
MNNIMIKRDLTKEILRLSKVFPVVAVTGPRQSGKTTLCKSIFPDFNFFNLENSNTREEIAVSPVAFLEKHAEGGIIFDEAQRYPELFSFIQVVADARPDYRFVLTGSSNFMLMEKITQSLAGRVALFTLLPLSLNELRNDAGNEANTPTDTLLFKGGYPAVWAKSLTPFDVISNYYNTYIERDVRQIENLSNLSAFQKFIRLSAGRIGTEFNASSLAVEAGVSVPTVQKWLSILEASYVAFRLPPFYENIEKRLVKSPKIYFYDTAVVCYLLGIENEKQLETHPLRGAIFENYVVLEFLKNRYNAAKNHNLYFYRDKSQREVDLMQAVGHQYKAFEIKSATVFHSDFMKNLKFLKSLLQDKICSAQLIYDGTTELRDLEHGMFNFRNIPFE